MKDTLREKVEECADKILKHERLVDFEGIQDFCSICGYPLGKEQKKELREFVIKNILSIINQEVIKGRIDELKGHFNHTKYDFDSDFLIEIVERLEQLEKELKAVSE